MFLYLNASTALIVTEKTYPQAFRNSLGPFTQRCASGTPTPETETFAESCSTKRLFWKISQISQEKNFDEVFSWILQHLFF